VVAASGAGATGGFAYAIARPALRRLGRICEYLLGIICASAYFAALAIVAPLVFDDAIITDRSDVMVFMIVSVILGVAIGHWWFKPQ
jgi:hypothetical protein